MRHGDIQDSHIRLVRVGQTQGLRAVGGLANDAHSRLLQHGLDELLSQRERLNATLQEELDKDTEPWGIKVSKVEVKDVDLPENMQRAMAKQAEAEREKRAKVINADGEFQASQTLANAAKVISSESGALQLRFLQTMVEIGSERNTTVILPLPIELIRPLIDMGRSQDGSPAPSGAPEQGTKAG